ncbi:MAG: hypothetical protein ABEJ03_05430 [Candidatus Nanohaloarchaea archaeon]
MTRAVDANVILRGKSLPSGDKITVQEVLDEVESTRGNLNLDASSIKVRSPAERFMDQVRQVSEDINSPTSEADEKLLALAMDTSSELLTDDVYLQNLALHMDVDFASYMGKEAEEKRRWREECPSCGRETDGRCSRCGSETTRKPV